MESGQPAIPSDIPLSDKNTQRSRSLANRLLQCLLDHIKDMAWEVGFDPAFDPEFDVLPAAVQDELLAQRFDAHLGRLKDERRSR